MRKTILVAMLLSVGVAFWSGCQEDQKPIDPRRAKLEAHSSHLLRQQLAAKDKQILDLEQKLEDCQEEFAKNKALADNCMTEKGNEFMEMAGPMLEELNRIQSENRDLQAKIAKLKGEKEVSGNQQMPADVNNSEVQIDLNMPIDVDGINDVNDD